MSADELIMTIKNAVNALGVALKEQSREVEVLTVERDNALLRIEELERFLEDVDPNDRVYRGGVNPNA